tara:strand:- start:334 stop:1269 length:936 start_codon:yes stop_codon:yes gene_type:complete
MKHLAILTWSQKWSRKAPGRSNLWTRFYKEFSKTAKKQNLKVFIAHRKWCENGILEKAYTLENGKWKKVYDVPIKIAWIYFSVKRKTIPFIKKLKKKVKIINHFALDKICCDKYATYKMLPDESAIPTKLAKTKSQVRKARKKFGKKIIIKPRYGVRGVGIKKILGPKIPDMSSQYVVQPFINSSKGIPSLGIKGKHDLRLILINGELHHAYARIPKKGSMKGNCAQGAKKLFIPINKIPKDIITLQQQVAKKFTKYKPSIYSVDFILDKNQKPYIIELESHLGFLYYPKKFALRRDCFKKIFQAINQAYK